MNMTDPLADLLTRIRNANKAGFEQTTIPHSRLKEKVTQLLVREGYLKGMEIVEKDQRKMIVAKLKYVGEGEKALGGLRRVSRPSLRIYHNSSEVKTVRQGMGTAIYSTSKGMMTDAEARKNKVGGEILCQVW